jgi:hypothetical protein
MVVAGVRLIGCSPARAAGAKHTPGRCRALLSGAMNEGCAGEYYAGGRDLVRENCLAHVIRSRHRIPGRREVASKL